MNDKMEIGQSDNVVHQHKGLVEHQLTEDDIVALFEGDIEEHMELLRRLEPGEYLDIKGFNTGKGSEAPIAYVGRLREDGLDIGRGNAEYGFKIPVPGKHDIHRILRVFRRR